MKYIGPFVLASIVTIFFAALLILMVINPGLAFLLLCILALVIIFGSVFTLLILYKKSKGGDM
jgi:hypothetical protein